jgi:flavin-binding protein dodecin
MESSSEKGLENAAQTAVREEAKMVDGIRGIEVEEIAAKIQGKAKNARVQRRY